MSIMWLEPLQMNNDKVIPIRHGGPHDAGVEAHANLVTGEVEEGSWNDGPSNEFYQRGDAAKIQTLPATNAYRRNYERIFGHE